MVIDEVCGIETRTRVGVGVGVGRIGIWSTVNDAGITERQLGIMGSGWERIESCW